MLTRTTTILNSKHYCAMDSLQHYYFNRFLNEFFYIFSLPIYHSPNCWNNNYYYRLMRYIHCTVDTRIWNVCIAMNRPISRHVLLRVISVTRVSVFRKCVWKKKFKLKRRLTNSFADCGGLCTARCSITCIFHTIRHHYRSCVTSYFNTTEKTSSLADVK